MSQSESPFEVCDDCGTPVVDLASHRSRAHDDSPGVGFSYDDRECPHCGEMYSPLKADQTYCSHSCASAATASSTALDGVRWTGGSS